MANVLANIFGSSPVNRQAPFGTPMKVVKGEDVWRLQLSQWQCARQFSSPSYSKETAPQRQWPRLMLTVLLPLS